jgi:regulator of sirC expression with transglutaminase-like and TPR domain
MPNINQLPSLIQLLEDETIRSYVMKQLAAFGPSVEDELRQQHIVLNGEHARLIRSLLDQPYREWVERSWGSWCEKKTDKAQLETGLDILAQFQLGCLYPMRVGVLLDRLADEYDARYAQRDALDLSEFLFQGYGQGYGLHGADQEDFYNPMNSNLVHVIEQRRGIPISLACVYILVGSRLGLTIEGCNFPGHFLAVASTNRRKVIVDCFNGGTFINDESLASVNAQITSRDILSMRCSVPMIIARILRNLITAYQHAGDDANANTMSTLLHSVEGIL